ncbi:hypothetical protein GGP41_001046 [Bipolaris sorokiniana]|uniref:Carboxymuconolactone decarboxylase-like domain-containing protein n=1 Tax=Cochliobolus sativus TaxID=45130 RepID=A0A8H6DPZ8_COCSA|nr:hypothetical protein GGP41_001046 [Bipolaris sorokiniana]
MSQTSPPIKPRSKFDTGLGTRKGVVGEHYVNEALARGSSEFAFPMQELVTEWCWGNIWNCPSLDRKQRSLLNLGMLIALKSWPEVGVHIRGAINNEIRESILQSAVYCGVPAGLEAMKVATAVIDGMVAKGEHVRQLVG